MPYRLKKGESISEGVKRIIHEEAESAIAELSHASGKKRDEGIHEARKSIKKIRGLLRLVRPELGRIYRAENTRLGDVGRKLSEIRDATAIIEVFDGLAAKHDNALQHDTFASIRKGLAASKQDMERHAGIGDTMRRAASALRSIQKRAGGWPLKRDGFRALAPGLEDRYRRGRRAMAIAREDGAPENYHEWRKRVKDHWYHIRLLESLWTDVMQAHEQSLHDLETWLGDDHNLVVLGGKLDQEPEKYGDEKTVRLFLTLVGQEQKELRDKSLSLGERVYERKPGRFAAEMEKLWDAWQNEPDSMKEEEKEHRATAKSAQASGAVVRDQKTSAQASGAVVRDPKKKQPARAASARSKKTAAA